VIQGDSVRALPGHGRGLPPDDGTDDRGSVHTIVGRWPDAVWLVWRDNDTWSAQQNMGYDRVFRYRRDRWERIHETRHDASSNTLVRGLWEQPSGCLVGLLSEDKEVSDAWRADMQALDCPGQAPPPRSFKATEQVDFGIAAVLGLASGHVLVVEQPATMKEGESRPPRLALSRPGPPNRTEIDLPLPPEIARDRRSVKLADCRMLGASPTGVYLVGNYDLGAARLPLVLRFDGASFTPLPSPPVGSIGEADLAEDGTLVVLGSPPAANPKARSVWALRPGGEWSERPMPVEPKVGEPYRPWSVAARSSEDIWVVGYHENKQGKDRRLALFHSRRPAPSAGGAGAAIP
jgi:hypothetical protein